jgi:Integral membrane protein possibly involved in chromosome condensation
MNREELTQQGVVGLLIGFGGMVGGVGRHVLGAAAGGALAVTLVINAIGSFALGVVLFDNWADGILSERVRLGLGTGFLASFTTYSTFVADIALSAPGLAVGYLVGSYLAGFAGVVLSRVVVNATATATMRSPGDR